MLGHTQQTLARLQPSLTPLSGVSATVRTTRLRVVAAEQAPLYNSQAPLYNSVDALSLLFEPL